MPPERPQNALHERYASPEMAAVFSAQHRFVLWRRLWIALAECEQALGLPISDTQIANLKRAADKLDLARVAEIERQTRHDVVAHLRHFAEQAGEAGGILHLGATSAFITDNTDVLLFREALQILERRLAAVATALADFARRHRSVPTLAYTHLQPAQLTTIGKRACLWLQDFLLDLSELRHRMGSLFCRGAKGTTGTQASFLTLFKGNRDSVRRLDRMIAERLGFAQTVPVSGQTYTRKQDSQILSLLAGFAESCHKLGTDIRLLQGLGEISEPFDETQVGSSAMAYKRNPVRSERMCGLARRLISDSLNGPFNASIQWLERSLDDSANRRLVLPDAFLSADAILILAAHIAGGLRVHERTIERRVATELPFMATETFLMESVIRGGDRQKLHERIRQLSLEAREEIEQGGANPLVARIVGDPDFHLSREEVEPWLDARAFTGRAAEQVDEFLAEVAEPTLRTLEAAAIEEPRV